MKYHYVYRITNVEKKKYYYGKRTSAVPPLEDLGIKYFSSSTDKEFIEDQKSNPQSYKYKIVSIHKSSEEAIKKEIRLHSRFNVGVNTQFYNKVQQTAIKFDTTGLSFERCKACKLYADLRTRPRTAEEKAHISKKLTGMVRSDESKQRYSESKQGIKHPIAKLANIYEYNTNKLIAENVVISEWARQNNFDRNGLLQTVKGDLLKPSSRNNRCKYKNMYARYINEL